MCIYIIYVYRETDRYDILVVVKTFYRLLIMMFSMLPVQSWSRSASREYSKSQFRKVSELFKQTVFVRQPSCSYGAARRGAWARPQRCVGPPLGLGGRGNVIYSVYIYIYVDRYQEENYIESLSSSFHQLLIFKSQIHSKTFKLPATLSKSVSNPQPSPAPVQ